MTDRLAVPAPTVPQPNGSAAAAPPRARRSAARGRSRWVAIGIALVLLASGAAASNRYFGPGTPPAARTPSLKTAPVRTGTITLSATGTGSVAGAQEAKLGFPASGRLVALPVQAGAVVQPGQLLAQLDDAEARAQVAQAEIGVRLAELKLEQLAASADLARTTTPPAAQELAAAEANLAGAREALDALGRGPTPSELATAEQTLASTRAGVQKAEIDLARVQAGATAEELRQQEVAVEQARNTLWSKQIGRDATCGRDGGALCDAATAEVAAAESTVTQQTEKLVALRARPDPRDVRAAQVGLDNARETLRAAQVKLHQLRAGATADQVAGAQAKFATARSQLDALRRGADPSAVAAARAKVAQGQAQLEQLSVGADPDALAAARAKVVQAGAQLEGTLAGPTARDVEAARLAVDQARSSLALARLRLENTRLLAPFAGTVAAVKGAVGEETTGTAPVVTLADVSRPRVVFYVEETDLAHVKVGHAVEVTFTALPDVVVPGEVTGLNPVLVVRDGVPSAEAVAALRPGAQTPALLAGMAADVTVVAASAQEVPLVPREALRSLGPGRFGVFVVAPNGELELRPVEVGLQDFSFAEVRSGLSPGEVVSTGTVATK
jgi:RND family efflux transporter MFP subunit